MRVVLIDHYDSFSFNVLDWLASGGIAVDYVAFDDEWRMSELARTLDVPLVFSPGPKRPEDAPQSLALMRAALGRVPIFGVCLGHQLLALAAGASVVEAESPFHGSKLAIFVADPSATLFSGMKRVFLGATYNSLTVVERSLPPPWRVTARSTSGEVQSLSLETPGFAPAYGVQFHPESFLSEESDLLRQNLVQTFRSWEAHRSELGDRALVRPFVTNDANAISRVVLAPNDPS